MPVVEFHVYGFGDGWETTTMNTNVTTLPDQWFSKERGSKSRILYVCIYVYVFKHIPQ